MKARDLHFGPHVWRGRAGSSTHAVLGTGFAALDRKLAGGWPWGAMTEIFVDRYGIGEFSLLIPALAELSRQTSERGWIVLVAPPLIPYAPALVSREVDVGRILLVHPSGSPSWRSPGNLSGGAEAAASNVNTLWAVEQAVRSGASAAVLAWLRSADNTALRRLQLAAEERRCGLVLFRPVEALRQRSPAALRIRLSAAGVETRIEILKCRGARPAQMELDLSGMSS